MFAAGGHRPARRGRMVPPTHRARRHVDNGMEVSRNELFGPVLSVSGSTRRRSDALANDSPLRVRCRDLDDEPVEAHAVAHALDAGTVWVNTYRTCGFARRSEAARTAATGGRTASMVSTRSRKRRASGSRPTARARRPLRLAQLTKVDDTTSGSTASPRRASRRGSQAPPAIAPPLPSGAQLVRSDHQLQQRRPR